MTGYELVLNYVPDNWVSFYEKLTCNNRQSIILFANKKAVQKVLTVCNLHCFIEECSKSYAIFTYRVFFGILLFFHYKAEKSGFCRILLISLPSWESSNQIFFNYVCATPWIFEMDFFNIYLFTIFLFFSLLEHQQHSRVKSTHTFKTLWVVQKCKSLFLRTWLIHHS